MTTVQTRTCDNGNIHLIGIPATYRTQAARTTIEALRDASVLLRYQQPVDVVIIESQEFFVIPQLGIGGSAIGTSCIEVRIHFSRKDAEKIIEVELPATMYHELSHLVREDSIGHGDTLLDSLISEGVACFIEKSVFPKRNTPYIQTIEDEKKIWGKARKLFGEIQYDYSEWFFGTGALPNWTGYRLGYVTVEAFMKKNDIDLAQLVRMESKKIWDKGYCLRKA